MEQLTWQQNLSISNLYITKHDHVLVFTKDERKQKELFSGTAN